MPKTFQISICQKAKGKKMFSSNNSYFGIGTHNLTIKYLDDEQLARVVQPKTIGSDCD